MAKDEAEKAAADERTPSERIVARKAAEQQFWQTARARKKKGATGRILLIVGGLALGASIAAAALYGPQLLSPPARPATAAAAGQPLASNQPAAPQGPRPLTGPAQAIDGATLTVAGQRITLQGVEAPPASLVCRTSAMEYRCGDVARRVLDSFAGGAPVACLPATDAVAGSSGTVAVCRNHRGWDLAALQVEAGWAIIHGAVASSPYRAQQARAQANGAGLWPAFAKPEQWPQAAAR